MQLFGAIYQHFLIPSKRVKEIRNSSSKKFSFHISSLSLFFSCVLLLYLFLMTGCLLFAPFFSLIHFGRCERHLNDKSYLECRSSYATKAFCCSLAGYCIIIHSIFTCCFVQDITHIKGNNSSFSEVGILLHYKEDFFSSIYTTAELLLGRRVVVTGVSRYRIVP